MFLTSFNRSLLRQLALVLAFAAASLAARAQDTGALTGRVSDATTGASLKGATIRVLGTSAAAVSDQDGRYYLPAIPAGPRSIEVEYVGLDPLNRSLDVPAGRTTVLHVELHSSALKLAPFAVTESVRGQALAVNQQKTAAGIVNIVSEETFGQMIGGNIGYALQRLPGLTVNENEDGTPAGVNIRGLEAKYNSFQVDGNRVPTSDTTRGFATGQLTADGISNIEVVKAPTPDRDGDAIGGIINVTSRSAFERDGRSIQLSAGGLYYDLNEKWGYQASALYSDLLSVAGGTRNLGVSFTASTYETSRDYDNLDKDYAIVDPAAFPALGLSAPVYAHTNGTPQTNFRDTFSTGFNLALDYRLSDRVTFYLKPFLSDTSVEAEKPRSRYYSVTSLANLAALTYNTGTPKATALTEVRYQNELNTRDNVARGVSFGGKHELDTIIFTYDAFLSANEIDRNHTFSYVIRNQGYSIGYDQTARAAPVYTILNGKSLTDYTAINRGDLTITDQTGREQAASLKADWEKKFVGSAAAGSLKFGAKYRQNTKEREQTQALYRTGTYASGFPYASFLRAYDRKVFGIPMAVYTDIHAVEALFQSTPSLFAYQPTESLRASAINDYEAQEDIAAAYAMGTITLGATQIITGLRMEQNTFSSDTYKFNNTAPTAAPTRVHAERDYTVWLPGLHLRHELRKNLILRASYNRSYARPDIDLLVAGLQVDTTTGNMSGGNPNLKETTSDNLDLQLEYYTARSGLYSVGFFHKKMKGFYYERTFQFSATDADGYPIPDAAGPYTFSTTDNAQGAVNYGVELIARQNLYFLPAPFDGLSVSLSATFTESDGQYPGRLAEKLPTYGFSDKIYFAALEYARHKFRTQVSYRYRSDYLEGLDANNTLDDYFGANESLDWENSYQFTPKLKGFLNFTNLTDEPQISYQGFRRTDNPEDYTQYSWRATVGATYTF